MQTLWWCIFWSWMKMLQNIWEGAMLNIRWKGIMEGKSKGWDFIATWLWSVWLLVIFASGSPHHWLTSFRSQYNIHMTVSNISFVLIVNNLQVRSVIYWISDKSFIGFGIEVKKLACHLYQCLIPWKVHPDLSNSCLLINTLPILCFL